jgi:hypothetical protein
MFEAASPEIDLTDMAVGGHFNLLQNINGINILEDRPVDPRAFFHKKAAPKFGGGPAGNCAVAPIGG